MGKPTKSTTKAVHKSHGPKRKLFNDFPSTIRLGLANAGLLSKYTNKVSFELACQARGQKNISNAMWLEFYTLPTKQAKDAWLANLTK